ncbi:hypothetical protein [Pseudoroseomonas sp. WGS1072]|uniref:hypothetical protein n=1 Tax=Roseomonas sp. WGS1072 TaxID=3366816 RepID=UPI003BF23494
MRSAACPALDAIGQARLTCRFLSEITTIKFIRRLMKSRGTAGWEAAVGQGG